MSKGLQVIYYTDNKSQNIISHFIDSLPIKTQAKILRIFQILEKYGLGPAIPHLKKVNGTEPWEIRILGKDNVRFLYVAAQRSRIIILHGFIKKTRKTPRKEIKLATSRYSEWLSKGKFIDK